MQKKKKVNNMDLDGSSKRKKVALVLNSILGSLLMLTGAVMIKAGYNYSGSLTIFFASVLIIPAKGIKRALKLEKSFILTFVFLIIILGLFF